MFVPGWGLFTRMKKWVLHVFRSTTLRWFEGAEMRKEVLAVSSSDLNKGAKIQLAKEDITKIPSIFFTVLHKFWQRFLNALHACKIMQDYWIGQRNHLTLRLNLPLKLSDCIRLAHLHKFVLFVAGVVVLSWSLSFFFVEVVVFEVCGSRCCEAK